MLTLENAAAAVVLGALCAYTVFGGADFGSGLWVLLASGPRARQQREALLRAIGPVWETNHIWLIVSIVALFTAFPAAFAAAFQALFTPLTIALIGITFRGAAFAFHHYAEGSRFQLPATILVFAAASLLTPLMLGACVGAIAAGEIHAGPGDTAVTASAGWLQPFPVLCGLIALCICALLTSCYMTVRTEGELRADFRLRAISAALALGALTAIALAVARAGDSYFSAHLWGLAGGGVGLSALLGLATLLVLAARRYSLAPVAAAGTSIAVLLTWGAAQYPYILPPGLTIAAAASPRSTLTAFMIAIALGLAMLAPALFLLMRILASGRADLEGAP